MRIISIVPSITELLFDLGLDQEVVGLTKFCVHPREKWKSLPRVGGTKTVHIDRVQELQPDLVIANKEENTKEDVEALRAFTEVVVTEINTVPDAFNMLLEVGGLTGRMQEAKELHENLSLLWNAHRGMAKGERVAYGIWENPLMLAGKNTFIDAVLEWFGWENVLKENRYPQVSHDELVALQPERLMLSSEPFPFKAKHIETYGSLLPKTRVELVDGEAFSWYGSRMRITVDHVKSLSL